MAIHLLYMNTGRTAITKVGQKVSQFFSLTLDGLNSNV